MGFAKAWLAENAEKGREIVFYRRGSDGFKIGDNYSSVVKKPLTNLATG
jgi:hypothetical protein